MRRNRTRILVAVVVAAGLAVGVLLGVLASAIVTNRDTADAAKVAAAKANRAVRQIEAESRARRDQSCRISEETHKDDVDSLRRTYKYLLDLTPRQKQTTFNRALLANLPNVERKARQDPAPPFCDEPGIGLPEPDPVVPKRPKSLTP